MILFVLIVLSYTYLCTVNATQSYILECIAERVKIRY